MSLPPKVMWGEGLTLGPHQFQQQDRYHEARLQRLASALNPYLWGVRSVQWKIDGLANNSLSAESISLIFQDGELYEAPGSDALPAPIDLTALPADDQSVTFYAALPAMKAHGGNVASNALDRGARYVQVDSDLPDLFSDSLSIDVSLLKKTVHLLSRQEARKAYLSFPVIRVRRTTSGGFEIDPTFMPPGTTISAVSGLPAMLDNLIDKLRARIAVFYSLLGESKTDSVDVRSGDMAPFWMLHTIHSAGASLINYARSAQDHPKILFDKLTELAGGLMSFSRKYALSDLPAYRHDDPAPAFARLDAMIRDLVDVVMSPKFIAIPLLYDSHRTAGYQASLAAAKIDQHTTLCLAVSADMPPLELVASVPIRLKMGSPGDVDRMVRSSVSGLTLVHMPQVPAVVPARPNTYYFSIHNKEGYYEAMLKAQTIAIYVPSGPVGGMKDLKLELLVIAP